MGAAAWLGSHARRQGLSDRTRSVLADLASYAGPRASQIAVDRSSAMVAWRRQIVLASEPKPLIEQVARLLAMGDQPLLAADLACGVTAAGNLRERTEEIRALLLATPAFVQVRRGRWVLGAPATVAGSYLTSHEFLAWARRATSPREENAADQ